jgi:hypothetical protein
MAPGIVSHGGAAGARKRSGTSALCERLVKEQRREMGGYDQSVDSSRFGQSSWNRRVRCVARKSPRRTYQVSCFQPLLRAPGGDCRHRPCSLIMLPSPVTWRTLPTVAFKAAHCKAVAAWSSDPQMRVAPRNGLRSGWNSPRWGTTRGKRGPASPGL